MPQLAIETFFSQYFWLVTFLFCFYFYIMIYFIPHMSNILKTRAKLSGQSSDQLTASEDQNIVIAKNLLSNVVPLVNPFKGKIKVWSKNSKKLKASKPSTSVKGVKKAEVKKPKLKK